MLCRKPFLKGNLPLPCGQCMPCRINNRRVWTTRLTLESYRHHASSFITLTYSDENLPKTQNGLPTLVKRDLQLFMKRLRFSVRPIEVRFFAVGEYGERTFRPHYHALLFGLGAESAQTINAAWSLGLVHIGSLTKDSCQYCAGYVTKKMTLASDPRLEGRAPEFAIMSRKPGIGHDVAKSMGQQLTRSSAAAGWINKEGDVPKVARMEEKMWPLGRYMVSTLRKEVGFEDGNSPPRKKEEYEEKMRALRADYSSDAHFKAAAPYVEWAKSDGVMRRAAARAKFKGRIL